MYRLVDDIFVDLYSPTTVDGRTRNGGSRISVLELKKILEQRGIITPEILEREELDAIVEASGLVTTEELAAAQKRNGTKITDFSNIPDVWLHQKLVAAKWDPHSDSMMLGAHSVVFDCESAFVERVDDNKDSVWLLAVVVSKNTDSNCKTPATCTDSVVTSDVWGSLVHQYVPFGFKMGLIDCQRLPSVCHDRGFIAADLVLALPRGGDRIKDSVQFRPYPRTMVPAHPSSITYPRDSIVQHIRSWLASVLSERVSEVINIDQVLPAAHHGAASSKEPTFLSIRSLLWLRQRPPPLHLIWVPHALSQSTRSPRILTPKFAEPPMVLSALSVPFTGRIRFWTVLPSKDQTGNPTYLNSPISHSTWPVVQRPINTPSELLKALECPPNVTYLIITPEATCLAFGKRKGEFLEYTNLGTYMRFLYPSADDFLLLFTSLLNLVVILGTAIHAGKLFARWHLGARTHPIVSPTSRIRLDLIRTILRLARRGWTSHVHRRLTQTNNYPYELAQRAHSSLSNNRHRSLLVGWVIAVVLDIFSLNFLILISILPLINLFSLPYASVVVNAFLWLLRSFVTLPPLVALRLSIVGGHLTWFRLALVIFSCWFSVFAVAMHFYIVVRPSSRSSHRGRNRHGRSPIDFLERLGEGTSEELLRDLTRLFLHSSDMVDNRVERTSTSSISSTTDSGLPASSHVSRHSAASTDQSNTFLYGLSRIHHVLLNSQPVHTQNLDETATDTPLPVASAHIYTWQCSNMMSAKDKLDQTGGELSTEPMRFRKACRQTCDPNVSDDISDNQPAVGAYQSSNSSTNWDAETERRTAAHEVSARSTVRRRLRHRCSRLLLRSNSDSTDSSVSAENHDGGHMGSITSSRRYANWPSWVIPCDSCVVCWRSFRPHVRLGALPCGHGFHDACIRRWLDTGALDCPVCRWPACTPHVRQQRQIIAQLLTVTRSTLRANLHLVDAHSDTELSTV